MLTLISTFLGFASSGLPKILDFFQDKSDKRHELELARIQNERELAMAGCVGVAGSARIGAHCTIGK